MDGALSQKTLVGCSLGQKTYVRGALGRMRLGGGVRMNEGRRERRYVLYRFTVPHILSSIG
jgi:hypothetical protein